MKKHIPNNNPQKPFSLASTRAFAKGVALTVALGSVVGFAVSLPYTFKNGQIITAAQLNANFSSLKNAVDALETGVGGGTASVEVPLILTGSGLRIPNATLQASNDAGGIAAVISSGKAGNSDAALVLGQVGNGPLIKGFGANGGEDEFRVDTNGTVHLFDASLRDNIRLDNSNGVIYAKGFNNVSDRNAKTNFKSINPQNVLERVSKLPLSRWNYKTDPPRVQHIGPMAQDFEASFGLNGGDNTHINTLDAQGVALAAIQGLNAKLEAENTALKTRLDALEARLNALEAR
jgi:hypothetical protein